MASVVTFVFVSRIYTKPIFAFDLRMYEMFLCPGQWTYTIPTPPGGERITHALDLLAW